MNSIWRRLSSISHEEFLTEMANNKKKTISLISGYWWDIVSHFFKCIIFSTSSSINHLIDEIAVWLNYINNQFSKTKSLKLSKNVYLEEVFGVNNTTEPRDIRGWIENFQLKEGIKYPEFTITKGLVARCFEYFVKFADYFSSLFEVDKSDKNKTSAFKPIIKMFVEGSASVPSWKSLL